MKAVFAAFLAFCLVACSSIQSQRSLDQPIGRDLTTTVGGTVFRLSRTADLPNAWGKADVYGGKVDKGFAELKFLGMNERGEVILASRDVHMSSSENALERYAPRAVKVQVSTGQTVEPATQFAMAINEQRELTLAGVRVVFLDVKPQSLTYRLEEVR